MVSTYLMKSIYKKIKLSPFFLLIIFISLISGLFKDVITLFMIIIIHELGHIILSYLFKWNIKSVEIGVFGGFITYDDVIDKPFIEEIIISLGGFLMQGLIFLVTYILSKNGLFSIKETSLINRYNLSIFLFNVIPVYPLDGSKILLVILNMFIPYKKSLKISCFISVLLIFLIFLVLISLDVKVNSSYIIIGFFIMWLDKRKAIKGSWRIPEKTLFIITALGGGIGTIAGMYTFRHKTQKIQFVIDFPFITILEIVTIVYFVLK